MKMCFVVVARPVLLNAAAMSLHLQSIQSTKALEHPKHQKHREQIAWTMSDVWLVCRDRPVGQVCVRGTEAYVLVARFGYVTMVADRRFSRTGLRGRIDFIVVVIGIIIVKSGCYVIPRIP
ncbi:hypothetical protein CIB48_g2483 [Xylaria polymorpha]|nr:hypothetical protein CIB48_g2483 [Xylaria polymorpha]